MIDMLLLLAATISGGVVGAMAAHLYHVRQRKRFTRAMIVMAQDVKRTLRDHWS